MGQKEQEGQDGCLVEWVLWGLRVKEEVPTSEGSRGSACCPGQDEGKSRDKLDKQGRQGRKEAEK